MIIIACEFGRSCIDGPENDKGWLGNGTETDGGGSFVGGSPTSSKEGVDMLLGGLPIGLM